MIINSRYKVIKKLGSGRSDVFLVEDLEFENRLIALKLISKGQITQDELSSLRNEFRLLSGFNHPNIVQVYEFDRIYSCDDSTFLNSYFYTSEYISGKNLIEYFESPLKQSDLDKFYYCLKQICEVLYYIHQLNVIHFDIKPENFLIVETFNDEPLLKLIDFGFSTTTFDSIKGTPAYISPELILKQKVDFRTDLYSLGATLYHVITGKPPFESSNEVDLLKQHLEQIPPSIGDNYPKSLNLIVLKLLSKNPDDRFKNSLEILKYLPFKFQKIKNIWPLPKILYSRRDELKKILKFFSDENLEYVSLLLLSEEGMGKSFLVNKVIEYLDDNNLVYLIIKGEESKISHYNLLYLLVKQIEFILVQKRKIEHEDLIKKINFVLSLFEKSESSIDSFENLRNYIAEIFIEFARKVNYVIIIDDFNLLDEPTKSFIIYIYPSLMDFNVKFLLSSNLKFILQKEVENFSRSMEIILTPFTEKDIHEMLKSCFHFDFPYEPVTKLIVEYTDLSIKVINEFLNNLFVSEILQFNENGFILRNDKIEPAYFKRQIESIHQKKFNLLTTIQKEIIEYISFLILPIKIKLLSEAITLDYERLKNEILLLASFGWIEYSKLDETVFMYNNSLRNYINSKSSRRKEICLRFAELFESESFPRNIIAEYFSMAGYTEKALDGYLKAAKEAENFYSFSTMESYLKKCLTLDLNSEKILEIKYLLTKCYFNQSEYKNAEKLAQELIELITYDERKLYDLYLILAIIKYKIGEIDQAYEYFDEAYRYAFTDEQKIEVEINQINLELSQGNFDLVRKKCENLLKEYSNLLSDRMRAAILNNLGICYSQLGLYKEAISYFNDAFSLYENEKNIFKTSQLFLNLGNIYNLIGNKEKALEYWEKALTINENVGNLSQKATILNNIGISFLEEFNYEDALRYYMNSEAIFEKINNVYGKSLTLFNLGETNFFLCNYSDALKSIDEAINLSKKLVDIEGQCLGLFLKGLIFYNLNEINALKEITKELLAIIERNKIQSLYLQNYLYLDGLVSLSDTKYEDAINKLELAREIFSESDKRYYYCQSSINLMWAYLYNGDYLNLKKIYNELSNNSFFKKNYQQKAETLLILSEASKRPGSNMEKNSFHYCNEALQLIEKTYIGEITWQVLLAVGEEYLIKGIVSKGIDYFLQAKKVINFLLSKIKESEHKNSYLENIKLKRSLDKINKVLNGI